MTPEEVFERADEITAETRYRIQSRERRGMRDSRRDAGPHSRKWRAHGRMPRKRSPSPWMSGGGD